MGMIFARIMNLSHSNVTDWGLAHVLVEKDFVILDVGCGGGRTIQKLAAINGNFDAYVWGFCGGL